MPTGPFGFPRLTDLGPFVEPDRIKPAVDVEPRLYPLSFIADVQFQTATDTAIFLAEGREEGIDVLLDDDIAEFEYKQIILGELLDDSEFSAKLTEIVQRNIQQVKKEIQAGKLEGAESLCNRLKFESTQSARNRCAGKVERDIDRVMEINNKIRDTREYFPPTIFPMNEPGDTIDGAHRIVALASVLGTEERIWVWELQNQDAVTDILVEQGVIRGR